MQMKRFFARRWGKMPVGKISSNRSIDSRPGIAHFLVADIRSCCPKVPISIFCFAGFGSGSRLLHCCLGLDGDWLGSMNVFPSLSVES